MQVSRVLLVMLFSLSLLIGMPAYCFVDELIPGLTVASANIYPSVIVPKVQPDVDPTMKVPPVGRVVWVKGIFKAISSENKERPLEKTSIIYLHDTLMTGVDSQAQIVFTDNTLMTFKPSTKFVIENYSFEPQQKKGSIGKYFMNLIEGGFRTITGLIAKGNPPSYQVNTPVATIGVRGTDYVVYLRNGRLDLGYYNGSPCVSSGGGQSCLSADNQYAEVSRPGAVPRIVRTRPLVFRQKLPIVPARIAPAAPGKIGNVVTTGPGSTGEGTGTGTSSGSDATSKPSGSTSGGTTSGATSSGGTSSGESSSNTSSGESGSVGSSSSDASVSESSSGGTSTSESSSGDTSSGESGSSGSSSGDSSSSQQQVGAASSDASFQPDSGSVGTMNTDTVTFAAEATSSGSSTSSSGATSGTTSGTSSSSTSNASTASSSSSSSSQAGSTVVVTGTESSTATGMTITGTEVQVNTPAAPTGTVSSFCIVQ